MAFDFKDVLKEHKKILLPSAGVLLLVLVMTIFLSNGISPLDMNNGLITGGTNVSSPSMQLRQGVDYQAVIKTNEGNITVDLYENIAPLTVNNFVYLSNKGFYNNLTFHRIVKDFVIQGGDPRGDGTGGPGYSFKDEIDASVRFEPYVLAMANAGPDTNGSQFFITTAKFNGAHLNGQHTIFGKVIKGFDVVDSIENVSADLTGKPFSVIRINTIDIIEK